MKFFELLEQFVTDTLLIKLTEFEKTDQKKTDQNEIPLSELEVDQVFVTVTLLLFDSGACLPFNKENELNLKRN